MRHVAKGLASLGRGEDKMLVHMTPNEVRGLQAIALAHGGSLTINPHTGLPEAGYLKALLPMIAGIVAAPFTAGTSLSLIGPALAGAVTQGAVTGDWTGRSLVGGALSGWGGGGLGSALSGAGAATQGGLAAAKAAVPVGQSLGVQGGAGLVSQAAGTTGALGASNILRGVGAALTNPTTVGSQVLKETGKARLLAGATGAKAGATKKTKTPPTKPFEYYVTKYHPGTVNPKWGQPGEPYFVGQGYDEGYWTTDNPYKSTPPAPTSVPTDPNYQPNPLLNYADGGTVVAGQPKDASVRSPVADYIAKLNAQHPPSSAFAGQESGPLANYISSINAAKPQALSPLKLPVAAKNPRASYMQGIPFGGYAQYAQYAPAHFAHGGAADGGSQMEGAITGNGDGMSDDVHATIYRDDGSEQEARLADGEFVIPADVVSGLGNGSTNAGNRVLYEMLDKVRMARTGTKQQAKEIDPEDYLPA